MDINKENAWLISKAQSLSLCEGVAQGNWVPGGEITDCPFQGQPGLLTVGGAAAG